MKSLILAVIFAGALAQGALAQEESLTFSARDVETLREIQRVRDLGRATATLFLTAPVVSMLTSTSTASFIVSVLDSDFRDLWEAASNMSRITACQVRNVIAIRLIDSPAPTPAVARYFNRLHDAADETCDGNPRREPQSASAPPETPKFVPLTVRPQLRNTAEVQAALILEYPQDLRQEGVGGTVYVWVYIDERGIPTSSRIERSSNLPALDAAALRVADLMRFTPARNAHEPTGTWVQIPIIFSSQ